MDNGVSQSSASEAIYLSEFDSYENFTNACYGKFMEYLVWFAGLCLVLLMVFVVIRRWVRRSRLDKTGGERTELLAKRGFGVEMGEDVLL